MQAFQDVQAEVGQFRLVIVVNAMSFQVEYTEFETVYYFSVILKLNCDLTVCDGGESILGKPPTYHKLMATFSHAPGRIRTSYLRKY